MKKNSKRSMWQTPWSYPESAAIVSGIVVVGIVLQLSIGSFDFFFLAAPVNLIMGMALIGISFLTLMIRNRTFLTWLTGAPFSVCLILALALPGILMGSIPQNRVPSSGGSDLLTASGIGNMTSSWPFVLLYLTTLFTLGTLVVHRLRKFSTLDFGFYLNHIGLYLVLFATGLGYADLERYIMHVREGEMEWRVYDNGGNAEELPLAIKLNDFDMEVYPPSLTIIDRKSGEPQSGKKSEYFALDHESATGKINGWELTIDKYIHQAVRNSDSTYREVPMPGATPAAKVTMRNPTTGKLCKGWVCGGNQAQLYMTLDLDDQYALVMTTAEPKRFSSDIEVFTKDGSTKKAILEVNKPLQIDNWTIYQHGYDNAAGSLSSYSSMELVYDPWLVPVYSGFVMVALGAFTMIWRGRSRIRRRDQNEISNLKREEYYVLE